MLRFGVDGEPADFQPVLCADHAAALATARRALEQRPNCDAVDVLLGDTQIFQLVQAD